MFLQFWDAGVLNSYILMLQTVNDASILKATLDGIYSMLKSAEKLAVERGSEENMVQ